MESNNYMEQTQHVLKTGTTTIGLVCEDGIVLAADKRVTAGHSVMAEVKKVIPVGERFAVTIAGTASDAVMLARHLKSELKLKELRSGNEVTVREAANLLAQFVYSNIRQPSVIQGITHFLFSGYDKDSVELYDVFPDGSITKVNDYYCSGSGSVYAYGVIDSTYQEGLSIEQGSELAKKAIKSAIKRDTASGNGYLIYSITKDGVQQLSDVTFESPME